MQNVTVSLNVWDIERLYRFVSSGKKFEPIEIDFEEDLIIRCLLPGQGRPKRYVNGVSVTAEYLKQLSRPLITIYGQNEHQNLSLNH